MISSRHSEVDLVPTIDEFRPLVLRVLNHRDVLSTQEIHARIRGVMGLSDEAVAQQIPSGQPRYMNRINWACSALKHAGLIESVRRGYYRILEDGVTVDKRNLSSYSEKEMLEWPVWAEYKKEVAARQSLSADIDPSTSSPVSAMSSSVFEDAVTGAALVESLEHGVDELNAEVETNLRRRLQESSPEFFEKAVIELLWAMGYGGAHGEKKHVGRSNDGGIDGVIRQDALGLQNVYVQAKRYADSNTVQRPEIQQFFGALASRGAEKGVFITTSRFSAGARTETDAYQGRIILIDGIRLTRLMLNYEVAVQKAKTYVLYEVDDDFFDEDSSLG